MEVMRRYLTEEEQSRLLKTVGQYAGPIPRRDGACMRLLAGTGMRLNELVTCTVGDAMAALENGYLFVPRERRKGGRKDHSYLVTEPVRQALQDLLAVRSTLGHAPDPAAPLVMSRKHAGMSARGFQQRVAYWAGVAGIQARVSPHWFRHTRAMNIMRRSTSHDPRGVVQAALGHSSIGSTGIYTRISKEDLAAALQEVDGARGLRKRDMRRAYERRVGS